MNSEIDDVARAIVNAAYRISTKLGPGLRESIYETVLARDLTRSGLRVERQKCVSFEFEGLSFKNAFRIDMLVEHLIVIEIKSKACLHPEYYKQLLTYLRLTNCRLGFLINFNNPTLKGGIKRVANGL